ncbi:predicted protein [Naegleria gruberi]|uniref:Kinase n=1 Tax=Naegleria gruberi TaxID=5762 RepID=D2VQ37_NAEGR|nr:uncharacterized protein NAEGRDRAFT_71150 [Naegleria gruberi]EFC41115.1 predicted protein [Naegleria gruberi]|eukprot:XP_002673859.1 predicted protein [Naegleria gruberi strain NEG-M]
MSAVSGESSSSLVADQQEQYYIEKTDYGELKITPIDINCLEACMNQVAGHGTRKKKKELSLMVRDCKIYKAIQPGKKRSWSEVHFYENQVKLAAYLLPFIPKYYGVQRTFVPLEEGEIPDITSNSSVMDTLYLQQAGVSTNSDLNSQSSSEVSSSSVSPANTPTLPSQQTFKPIDFIVLEDITANMDHPNVMDIKMGQRTYGEDASPQKILEEESKYVYQHQLGMRISGAKIYDIVKKEYQYFDRQWGRSVTPDTIVEAMETFLFSNGFDEETRVSVGRHVTNLLLKEVRKIHHLFTEKNDKFRMYASSLLIVYDRNKNFSMKIIDFSHVHQNLLHQPVYDTNFIQGLVTIISVLETLEERYSQQQ